MIEHTCEHCGETYIAKRRNGRFCSDRCRGRAYRRQTRRAPLRAVRAIDRAEVLAELDATLELLPRDIALLERRHPFGEDADVDELIGGLDTLQSALERIREWVRTETPERGPTS